MDWSVSGHFTSFQTARSIKCQNKLLKNPTVFITNETGWQIIAELTWKQPEIAELDFQMCFDSV